MMNITRRVYRSDIYKILPKLQLKVEKTKFKGTSTEQQRPLQPQVGIHSVRLCVLRLSLSDFKVPRTDLNE